MIEEQFKKIAEIVNPNHVHIGTTRADGFIQYWMNSRYSKTTTSIVYDIEENHFEYQGLIIKSVTA